MTGFYDNIVSFAWAIAMGMHEKQITCLNHFEQLYISIALRPLVRAAIQRCSQTK